MKRALTLSLIALTFVTNMPASQAMGSGDKYSDLQTGVTYGIYKPTTTLGLPPLNFEIRPCRLFPKKDAYLLAGFGGMDHGIALVETAAAFNCTGVDTPVSLGSTMINGNKAQVGIYCPTKSCPASKFSQYGGEITWTTPKTKVLAATYIRLGTQGGFTLKQLTDFATGLKLVGKK